MCTPILKVFLRPIFLIIATLGLAACQNPNIPLTGRELEQLLPYRLNTDQQTSPPIDALQADVILVGGKEALSLGLKLKNEFLTNTHLKFYSLTTQGLNLARIFQLFSTYQFQAKYILYLPSSGDELENLFDLQNSSHIISNLARIQSWWWPKLYRLLPGLALSLLKKVNIINLSDEPITSTTKLSDSEKINRSLTSSSLFKFTLTHWLKLQHKSKFILLSTPYDPNVPPSNCKLSLKWPNKKVFNDQLLAMNESNWEKALAINDSLKIITPFNATTYYIRAKIYKKLGHNEDIFGMLNLSQMLNCTAPYTAWKNVILAEQKPYKENQLAFYDFAKLIVDQCFAEDSTCFDNGDLVDKWYEASAQALTLLIKNQSL